MIRCFHTSSGGSVTLCIDSYDSGVLQGVLFTPGLESVPFSSLSQFLIKIDSMLEQNRKPQAYTTCRTFSPAPPEEASCSGTGFPRKGRLATFEIRILYRHHSSWQGRICWLEQHRLESFRSALELIFLMNSALLDADCSNIC